MFKFRKTEKVLHGNKNMQGLEFGGGLLQRDELEEERNRPIIR